MNMFSRTLVDPDEVSPGQLVHSVEERVRGHSDYASYTSIDTGVAGYDAITTLAGLDRTLGRRATRRLLEDDAESALHVSALVFRKFIDNGGTSEIGAPVDLQTTLMVNITKELVSNDGEGPIERRGRCEDLLRRCTLLPEFKRHVLNSLIINEVIDSPFLVDILIGV